MRNWIHVNELNEAMNCKKSVKNEITPGMGATMYVGSDRYAMVVIKVITPKKIMVAHVADAHVDKFITENGVMILPEEYMEFYGRQNKTDEWGHPLSYHCSIEYTLRKNGRWMPKGEGMWGTSSIHVGHAEEYRDPSY